MKNASRRNGLEISEDLRFQQREWRIQRIIWVLLYLLLAAIMLGVLGKGRFSDTRIGAADSPVQLEYQRFMRFGAPDELRFTLRPAAAQARLEFDSRYFSQVELTEVVPRPDRMLATSDSISFFFPAAPGESMQIVLSIKPKKIGGYQSWFRLHGQEPQSFSQFIYP